MCALIMGLNSVMCECGGGVLGESGRLLLYHLHPNHPRRAYYIPPHMALTCGEGGGGAKARARG